MGGLRHGESPFSQQSVERRTPKIRESKPKGDHKLEWLEKQFSDEFHENYLA